MTPTISFHRVDRIVLGPIAHFNRAKVDGGAGEFWTRDLTLIDDDGDGFMLSLFSEASAEQLELGGGSHVISCSCGYAGPDVDHIPPKAEPAT